MDVGLGVSVLIALQSDNHHQELSGSSPRSSSDQEQWPTDLMSPPLNSRRELVAVTPPPPPPAIPSQSRRRSTPPARLTITPGSRHVPPAPLIPGGVTRAHPSPSYLTGATSPGPISLPSYTCPRRALQGEYHSDHGASNAASRHMRAPCAAVTSGDLTCFALFTRHKSSFNIISQLSSSYFYCVF